MRRITFLLATLLLLGACKEAKKASDRTASPYQELADQYAEFPLTTDLSKLTEKEKQYRGLGCSNPLYRPFV